MWLFFARLFGFVAKKQSGGNDNTCHLFAELDPGQPASAIVNFVTKVMIGQGKKDWRELNFHWFLFFSPLVRMYQSSDDQCLDSFIHVFCRCCKILLILTIKRSEMHNPINYSTREREGRKGQRRREREKEKAPYRSRADQEGVFFQGSVCLDIVQCICVTNVYFCMCYSRRNLFMFYELFINFVPIYMNMYIYVW